MPIRTHKFNDNGDVTESRFYDPDAYRLPGFHSELIARVEALSAELDDLSYAKTHLYNGVVAKTMLAAAAALHSLADTFRLLNETEE